MTFFYRRRKRGPSYDFGNTHQFVLHLGRSIWSLKISLDRFER